MTKSGRKSKSRSLTNPQTGRPLTQAEIFAPKYSNDEERGWAAYQANRKYAATKKGKEFTPEPFPGIEEFYKRCPKCFLVKRKPPKTAGSKSTSPDDNAEPESSADQIISMMRRVFKDLGGFTKLKSHMKANPKDFGAMLQNLMKIEASLEEKRIMKGGGDDAKGVFVVMKGLSDDDRCPHCHKRVNDPVDDVKETTDVVKDTTGNIDMGSMESILNPGAEPIIREGGDW
jgi:hypothetical protein